MDSDLLDSKILCSETFSNMPHILSPLKLIPGEAVKTGRLYGKMSLLREGGGKRSEEAP